MKYLLTLHEASSRAIAGGKGEGLHKLKSWGLNVPVAYVVSSAAYSDVMANDLLAELVSQSENEGRDSVDIAGSIRTALKSVELPDGLLDEIGEAWKSLSGGAEGQISVSCRSSGTAEDSSSASFAGQFATVLGLSGVAGIESGIRECWASAWSAEAAAYSRSKNVDVAETSMAVVIQRMVKADVSGVSFSVNPVTGSQDEVMINSSWGLGEAVVSGLVTPDTFLVSKADRSITTREISTEKTVQHVTTGSGDVVERQVDPVTAMMPSLTDDQVVEVAGVAIKSETEAGSSQDIEWAYEAGELFVLQTRPVTTV